MPKKIHLMDECVYLVRFRDDKSVAPLVWMQSLAMWIPVVGSEYEFTPEQVEVIEFLYRPSDYELKREVDARYKPEEHKNINGNYCATNKKGNWLYFGYERRENNVKGKLVYIGTTMQKPSDRFRWHKHNGKDLIFEIQAEYPTPDEMLDAEVKLIAAYNPKLNKKTKRHNDNRRKSDKDINARKGNSEWCQGCLKRRVNKGYKRCLWCS